MTDPLGRLLTTTPRFRGKDRLSRLWTRSHRGRTGVKDLPCGGRARLDLGVPYEASVWLGLDDRLEVSLLHRLLSPGDVFVDCGANIGVWTLAAAAAVGSEGSVIAFEPNPATFRKLVENVALSGFGDRVVARREGVGHERRRLPLLVEGLHDMSRIVGSPSGATIEIEVVALDDSRLSPVTGLKLDIEGFELQALQGASELIDRERPWISVELNTALTGTARLGDWAVHTLLTEAGYRCRTFEGVARGDRATLSDDWTTSLGHCNLLYEAR